MYDDSGLAGYSATVSDEPNPERSRSPALGLRPMKRHTGRLAYAVVATPDSQCRFRQQRRPELIPIGRNKRD